MKLLAMLTLAIFALVACDAPQQNSPRIKILETESLKDVKGLEDCTYTKLDLPSTYLRVVRCPNSTTTTTYSNGKSTSSTTTISE